MKKILEGGFTGLIGIAFWVVSITQFFGIYTYFSDVKEWNSILSFVLSLVTCGIPIIGTILGAFGAHDGWGWGWPASFILYLWPYALALLIGAVSKIAAKAL